MNQINHNVFIVQCLAEKSLHIIVADKSITKVNTLYIMLPLFSGGSFYYLYSLLLDSLRSSGQLFPFCSAL